MMWRMTFYLIVFANSLWVGIVKNGVWGKVGFFFAGTLFIIILDTYRHTIE